MEKDTIFYGYTTSDASIFVNFCGIFYAGTPNVGTFDGVAHPLEELYNSCILSV